MSDDQQPAWAKAMEERLIGGLEERLAARLEEMDHRLTSKILELIADSEQRLTRRINQTFAYGAVPTTAAGPASPAS